MRLAADTGGTFTDLVVDDGTGWPRIHKAPTTIVDPIDGLLDVLGVAADARGLPRSELLGQADVFVHGTTRALNAILTGNTARTALLTTAGHRDILTFREGGRAGAFDFTRPYPAPYVPRALTFEVPERIDYAGNVVEPVDEDAVAEIAEELGRRSVEAAAICLLWSVVNPDHERRVAELLRGALPGIEVSTSSEVNPILREYRRAMSASIDASLKPIMSDYLRRLEDSLSELGFRGRLLVVTSSGSMMDAAGVAAAPIHSINSGPAMAPVAGAYFAAADWGVRDAIVADTGGTSFDVSVVRHGEARRTRDTWLGEPRMSHLTGFPSIDVRSVGAGGGSIAAVDSDGLLHVGPHSAGSDPGPASYGRGGVQATVTDACVALGYIDPDYFLGGHLRLDTDAAENALEEHVASPLGVTVPEAAAAVLRLATEHMVRAVEDVALSQGLDVRDAVLVCGGGAAGLNGGAIGERLGCRGVLVPALGAALSATGALLSDLAAETALTAITASDRFDWEGIAAVVGALESWANRFLDGVGEEGESRKVTFSVDARYPDQIWELELPFEPGELQSRDGRLLRERFHRLHHDLFAVHDPGSEVEFVTWRVRGSHGLDGGDLIVGAPEVAAVVARQVRAYFPDCGWTTVPRIGFESADLIAGVDGPVLVDSPVTTVVVEPSCRVQRSAGGSLMIEGLETALDFDALATSEGTHA